MIVQAGIGGSGGGGGGGTVTSVTGTFPIIITGAPTVTPNVTIQEVYPRTVAQLQALASGNALIAGLIYQITDAYSGVAVINIKAFSTSVLEDYGFGNFQNNQMSESVYCTMWYDLTADKIYRVYEPTRNNDVSNSTNGGGNAVDQFKFNSNYWLDNVLVDCIFNGVTTETFKDNNMTRCTLTLDNAGGRINGNTVLGTDAEDTQTNLSIGTDASACFLTNCLIGGNAVVTLTNGHTLKNCTIGAGKTVDLTQIALGYRQVGKVYDWNVSTFEVTPAGIAAVNPNGSDEIDMVNFQFAGILRPDDDTNDLITFVGFPTDHKWSIYPTSSATAFNVKNIGNIKLNQLVALGVNRLLDGSKGDFAEFEANSGNSTNVSELAVASYT